MSFILAAVLMFGTQVYGPEPDLQQEIRKATFALYEREWNPAENKFASKFICSAISVAETRDGYYLLADGHCFVDKDKPNLKYYVSEESIDDPTLQTVTIEKYANTPKFDYAVLHLQTPREYPVFRVSFDDLPAVDTPVINVNFSFGLTKQTARGFIASGIMKGDEGGTHCGMCPGRYIATLGIRPGASGSAVIDEDTREVIGLVEGVFPGFAIGTIVMPMGKTFDDFMVDGSIMEKPPVEPPKVPVPELPKSLSMWQRFSSWVKGIWHAVFGGGESSSANGTFIVFED